MEDFEAALDIFEAEAYIALVQLVKIVLSDSPSVVVEADEEMKFRGRIFGLGPVAELSNAESATDLRCAAIVSSGRPKVRLGG